MTNKPVETLRDGDVDNRHLVGLPQDLDHLFFAESGLAHGLALYQEPSSQVLRKNSRRAPMVVVARRKLACSPLLRSSNYANPQYPHWKIGATKPTSS